MKKLLQLELIKNLSYTNFWVIAGLWAILYVLVMSIICMINISLPGIESKPYLQFPQAWSMGTWIASFFNLLLGILMIVSVCNEFAFKTFRSQMICGLTRNQLIAGKGLFTILIAFFSSIIVFLVSLVIGIIYTNFGSETSIFENSYLLLVYFIQALAYMAMGLFIAVIIRNAALSILTFILYFFPMEFILRSFLPETVQQFFPVKVISNLTPSPDIFQFSSSPQMVTNINGQISEGPPPVADLPLNIILIVSIAYIAIFYAASVMIIKKRNL